VQNSKDHGITRHLNICDCAGDSVQQCSNHLTIRNQVLVLVQVQVQQKLMLAVHTTYQELSRSTCSNSRLRSTIMCFLRAVWWRDKLIQIWLWIILSNRAGNMVAYAGSMSPHPLVSTLCAVCNPAGARTRYCFHVKSTRLNIDTDKWNECMVYKRWYF
jgi:hypothetical protein